jgi:hypothetical protein
LHAASERFDGIGKADSTAIFGVMERHDSLRLCGLTPRFHETEAITLGGKLDAAAAELVKQGLGGHAHPSSASKSDAPAEGGEGE